MARITTPVPGYSGQGPGNVFFSNGVAETEDPAVIAYCEAAGYGIDADPPTPTPAPVVDSRDVTTTTVGAPLRDAAVDPHPSDFRAPVGAGTADPHGPEVYAPGLPGGGLQPTAPPAPEPVAAGPDGDLPKRPAPSAPVAEWRLYAASQVEADQVPEVEKMTKAELVKTYGG